jgi:hypothetical protein
MSKKFYGAKIINFFTKAISAARMPPSARALIDVILMIKAH